MGLFDKLRKHPEDKEYDKLKKNLKKESDDAHLHREVYDMVKIMREAQVDEYEIQTYILTNLDEGENTFDGETFWVCRMCSYGKKLDSREAFIAHLTSYHG